jgi:hypothetical protein
MDEADEGLGLELMHLPRGQMCKSRPSTDVQYVHRPVQKDKVLEERALTSLPSGCPYLCLKMGGWIT